MIKRNQGHRTGCGRQELTKTELRFLRHMVKSGRARQTEMDHDLGQRLVSRGVIRKEGAIFVITAEGRQAIRRAKLAQEHDAVFAEQHQDRTRLTKSPARHADPVDPGRAQSPRIRNLSESPLQKLAHRKRSDGRAFLLPSQLEAGERLRSDFERGQITTSMGINWDRLGDAAGKSTRNGFSSNALALSDTAMAAQQDFRKAIDYVGQELAGALIDFCCFLKGLEVMERERLWPARSGKLIIAIGLQRLARHYGLADIAHGPDRNKIQHWGTDGYKPDL